MFRILFENDMIFTETCVIVSGPGCTKHCQMSHLAFHTEIKDLVSKFPCFYFDFRNFSFMDHGPSQQSSKEEYKPWK